MDTRSFFIIGAIVLAVFFLSLWLIEKYKSKEKRTGAGYRPPPPPVRDESEDWDSPPTVPTRPVSHTSAAPGTGRPVVPVPRAQRSLDAEYAQRHNLWICPHCETFNSMAAGRCAACGMIHGKGGSSYAM